MEVTVVGGYGRGLSFFVPRAPAPGETVSGATLIDTSGGKGSNQAVGIARLGGHVRFVTAIGADAAGQQGLALWSAEGINTEAVVQLDGTTMAGAIITDSSAENRIVVADGVLKDIEREHLHEASFNGADVVLVSTEIKHEVAGQALAMGKKSGALTVLNPAPVPKEGTFSWDDVDFVTPNETEAAQLLRESRRRDPIALARDLAQQEDVTVVMTVGSHGAIIAFPDGSYQSVEPCPVNELIDTTGAGDSFNAGFAWALGLGLSPVAAARVGNACGARTVGARGVIPALPRFQDIAGYLPDEAK